MLRREDAHPSRRFSISVYAIPAKPLRASPGSVRSFVYAIPDGKPLHTFPGIALAVQICRSFTYMQS
ncbi:hypothetical protein GFM13_28255 [Rhizobium leguminosarum bv. viciae]|nr:hypothetical protein [Rhizobium leguminosarum bv. viciae]